MLNTNLFTLNNKFEFTGDELPRSTKNYSIEESLEIEKQKEIRKAVKLPITKPLVYYKHPYTVGSMPYSVLSFSAKLFSAKSGDTFDWYDIILQVDGIDKDIRIHGDFFSEMQKPDFIEHANDVNDDNQ